MSGIRVLGLSANLTEKHLKIYFSNPRNGGGHIAKIYHPLPHATAVVIFEDARVAAEVLKKSHVISGTHVEVSATPRHIFRRAVVEVEKNVSEFLSLNPQIVDELQFIGEVNVNFQYQKEKYLLDGSWYKIEWALHYIDTMLEAFQFDMRSDFKVRATHREKQTNAMASRGARADTGDDSPPRSKEILNPNIPLVKGRIEQPASLPVTTGAKMSNLSKFSATQSRDDADYKQKPSRNKNVTSDSSHSQTDMQSAERKLYGRTVLANMNEDNKTRLNFYDSEQNGAVYRSRGQAGYQAFRRQDDSDSENEAQLAAAYDRRIGFADDTNFDENKSRPRRGVPSMTKGIDVSRTDFGETPDSFTFEVHGNLKVLVAWDDITKQRTDTIINPTTQSMSNVYGVSRAITEAAGHAMVVECQRFVEENGPLNIAGVMHTAAGGSLGQRCGNVIHTAGPGWREDESEQSTHMLVCTYINCFMYADQKLWAQSLATPLISAGSFGFPLDVCIGAFYDALLLFSTRSTTNRHLKEIRLVCFDQDSTMATIMIIQSLMDCGAAVSDSAATDRYRMSVSKYGFQADNFENSGKIQEDSDDNNSGDERAPENAISSKHGEELRSDRKVDEKRASDRSGRVRSLNVEKDDSKSKDANIPDAKHKNIKDKLENIGASDDTDSEDESIEKSKQDKKFVQSVPAVKEDTSSFYEKLGLKPEETPEKEVSDSEESSSESSLNCKENNVEFNESFNDDKEPGKIGAHSNKTKNVCEEDDDINDDESKDVEPMSTDKEARDAIETKKDECHESGNETEDSLPKSERGDGSERDGFKTSFGKPNLDEESNIRTVSDDDGNRESENNTGAENVDEEVKTEAEKTEEIYL